MAANLSSIICFPCKLCNKACLTVGDMCRSPFFLYVTVTTCLNVPPAIYSIISIIENNDNNKNCRGKTWLIVNLIFCIVNVLASWYFYCKIRKSFGYEDSELINRHSALARTSYIVCYDPIVTGYILVLISFFVWQCIGTSWILSDSDFCPDYIINPFGASLGFGWAFLFGGSCAFCCSLCCAGCDSNEYGHNNTTNDTSAQVQQQRPPDTIPASTSQPTSIYVPDHSVVTGLSSPTKTEPQPQRVHTNDPDMPYTEIPVAIAVPLPPPSSAKNEGEV